MLARYVPGDDGKKAKILSAALTVADVAINNPVVIEMINEEIPSMGFLDDWTNIMDQCMKDMYDNIGDWLNYGIWGIEGDENEKLLAEMKKKCKAQSVPLCLLPEGLMERALGEYHMLCCVCDPDFARGLKQLLP